MHHPSVMGVKAGFKKHSGLISVSTEWVMIEVTQMGVSFMRKDVISTKLSQINNKERLVHPF